MMTFDEINERALNITKKVEYYDQFFEGLSSEEELYIFLRYFEVKTALMSEADKLKEWMFLLKEAQKIQVL